MSKNEIIFIFPKRLSIWMNLTPDRSNLEYIESQRTASSAHNANGECEVSKARYRMALCFMWRVVYYHIATVHTSIYHWSKMMLTCNMKDLFIISSSSKRDLLPLLRLINYMQLMFCYCVNRSPNLRCRGRRGSIYKWRLISNDIYDWEYNLKCGF